jgi:hypothetical protein
VIPQTRFVRGDAEDQGLLWDANVLCDDLLERGGIPRHAGPGTWGAVPRRGLRAASPVPAGTAVAPAVGAGGAGAGPALLRVSDREGTPQPARPVVEGGAGAAPRPPWHPPRLPGRVPSPAAADWDGGVPQRPVPPGGEAGGSDRPRRAVDSTGIADSVLTQDTVSLIRSALRRCLERLAGVDPGSRRPTCANHSLC